MKLSGKRAFQTQRITNVCDFPKESLLGMIKRE